MATDNITDKNTLKSWFKRGLKPLEVQFHAWMDSYWHKSESIPTSSIENLETTLNSKAESSSVEVITKEIGEITKGIDEHINDTGKHKTEKEQGKLDNLADNPDATYASKDELRETKEFNTLYLNTADIDLETIQDGALDADLLEQFSRFDLEKPYNLIFNDLEVYTCDNVRYRKTKTVVRITATIPDKLQKDAGGNTIGVTYKYNTKETSIIISSTAGDEIFLTENTDGRITSHDVGWVDFSNKLEAGYTPIVYLKSKNSEGYCPMIYEFTKDKETNELKGFVEILYPKITENNNALYVEKWVFTNDIISAAYQYSLEKFPLEDQETPVFLIEATKNGDEFTVTNPDVIENIVTSHNESKKARIFLSWSPLLIEAESVLVSDSSCMLSFSCVLTALDTSIMNFTINASKSNNAWSPTVKYATLSQNDFMQVKNIHVITDYPTDLSAYADGSIFIKQEA